MAKMEHDQKLMDYIERYLDGNLSAEELTNFEDLFIKDPSVRDKVVEHQQFLQHLTNYSSRKSLIADMELCHQQLDVKSIKDQIVTPTSKIKTLWTKYASQVAIAASVALFAVTATLFSTGYFSQSPATNYSMLRRDVNRSSVKRIQTKKAIDKPANPGRFGGTGFAISSNGYVVTNYHVIQGADSVYIQRVDGQSFKVKEVYIDPACDLAVLQIVDPAFKPFTKLPYAFKKSIADLGEDVFTIGFPDDKSVYGKGYLSSRTGYAGDTLAYQVSIPVNPGNSGGPLLDNYGNVIGIISGKQTQLDGVAFAIKSKFILKSLATISDDSLESKLLLSKKNSLSGLDRKEQIKKMQKYIFMVKAY